ncbi:MAG: aryl-sulfate sulfotransferase [Actinomycetota bacterium]
MATGAGALALGLAVATASVVLPVGFGHGPVAAAAASVECAPAPTATPTVRPQLASFTPRTPTRLVDTRDGTGGVDAPIGGSCFLRLDLDIAGVPAEADAVALSVTALGEQPGFQQAFPCDDGRGGTSNVNNRRDRFPTPGLVIGVPDADRQVCVFTSVEADLILDLSGWWTEDGDNRFRAVEPVRVDDSRETSSRAPGGQAPRPIDLRPHVPAGTTAVIANLTIAGPAARGFATIFPCGTAAPVASNVNFDAGEARAVSVIVGLDADRRVCTASNVEHDVILDLTGFYGPAPGWGTAAELRPEAGTRLADSRDGTGGWTRSLRAGETRSLDVTSSLPDGSQVTGVVLNVTVTQPDAAGFVTVTRCGAPDSGTSSVNYRPGSVASNLVAVDLGTTTSICVFSRSEAHVIVDLFGVLRAETDDLLVERIELFGRTWPDYRPELSDVSTVCADPLVIDLDLLAGTRARVNGVAVEAGRVEVDLVDRTNDLVRVELRRGAVVQRHHVRCVPDDFRVAEVTSSDDPEPGWYLTTLRATGDTPARAVILDEYGSPVWYQDTPTQLALFERAADGDLLSLPIRNIGLSADPDRGAIRTALDGRLLEEYVTVDDPSSIGDAEQPTDHHDIVELPTGGVALISYPLVRNVDLTGLGDGFGTDEVIVDNLIQELDADGELVWQWRMSDHFAFEPSTDLGTTLVYTHDEVPFPVRWVGDAGHPGVDDVDVFHINSIELAGDGSGDYVVSARHVDAVFRIDRTTGDVVWILRSAEVTESKSDPSAVLTLQADPLGGPRRQHDAILIGDRLTLLDNRHETGQPARAVTYRIDATAMTATMIEARTQPDGATSTGLGSFRAGPDGGQVISWGGPIQPMFQHLAADGSPVLRFTLVGGGNPYRVVWYPPDAFNEIELRATSGRTMQIP